MSLQIPFPLNFSFGDFMSIALADFFHLKFLTQEGARLELSESSTTTPTTSTQGTPGTLKQAVS